MAKRQLAVDPSGLEEAAAEVAASFELEEIDEAEESPTGFFSTGCTVLNLAMTDNPFNGWPLGRISNLIGDSSSGKSFLALTGLAEVCRRPDMDEYKLVYDDIESADSFNKSKLFGKKAAARIHSPRPDAQFPNSNTIEDLYGNFTAYLRQGRPFIYIEDSLDALTTKAEQARAVAFAKSVEASPVKRKKVELGDDEEIQEEAEAIKGSFQTEKVKLVTEMLRYMKAELQNTQSALIVISQVRDNLDARAARFEKKIRAGGKALKFASTYEIWLHHYKNIMHSGAKVKIGDESVAKIKKNKITGKQREASFPLYYDYGIDDITANLVWLVNERVLPMDKLTIVAEEHFGLNAPREKLVKHIEQNPEYVSLLQHLVGTQWLKNEEVVKLDRRPRYE